ncbi:MAG: type I phosphomannose isomerase catalytic subunit [Bacteroidales bacterium]|jgi:mannose-6-phosphate isomerase
MNNILYPMQFNPVVKTKPWGGELWTLSDVDGSQTLVANGDLAGNNLSELTEIFMDDFVGENVFKPKEFQFGVLVKIISAIDKLSVQVHPNDEIAQKKGFKNGKSEMWYILDADPGSFIVAGFNKKITYAEFKKRLENNSLIDVLSIIPVKKNDVIYIPAGLIHAIGPNILLAEIQQTSDVTYRVFDWNRKDENGNSRELHVNEAIDAIDFDMHHIEMFSIPDGNTPLNLELFNKNWSNTIFKRVVNPINCNYSYYDSYVILVFLKGKGTIKYKNMDINYTVGSSILIPASISDFKLIPHTDTEFIEVYKTKS